MTATRYDGGVRILHIESGRKLYGGARQAGYLINGLVAAGVDNVLVCEPGHPLAGCVSNTPVVDFRSAGDLDLLFARRLRHIIRDVSPDIVQVHSRRGADRYAGRAARSLAVPAVLTRRVESREPALHLRRMSRRYAAVVAISSVVEQQLAAAGIESQQVHRIPSAVDTALFRPNPDARARLLGHFGLADDAVVVGVASQLIRRKGIGNLLASLPAVVAACPDLQLLVFGQGPERGALERQLRTLKLQSQVRLCGFTNDWPDVLPGLDLLLHPARREGLGSVILEAMAAGVPVVAQAAGGIVDVIQDGHNGWLVPDATPAAWRQVLVPVLANREEREQRARAARREIEGNYTIDTMTARYLRLYNDVCARAR